MSRSSSLVDGYFIFLIVKTLILLFLLAGEVQCIVKAVSCNWDPIGKAEIIYTGAAVTGLGSIVVWINIEDE